MQKTDGHWSIRCNEGKWEVNFWLNFPWPSIIYTCESKTDAEELCLRLNAGDPIEDLMPEQDSPIDQDDDEDWEPQTLEDVGMSEWDFIGRPRYISDW